MSLSATGTEPDRLLDGYRAARAQESLFDLRSTPAPVGQFGATGYDEFVDASGEVRPAWQEFAGLLAERGRQAVLDQFTSRSSYARDKRVQVDQGTQVLVGTTAGLNSSGFLMVRGDDGTDNVILSGGVRPV